MTRRLAEDHRNARYLAGQLGTVPGLEVDTEALDINMVFFSCPPVPTARPSPRT
jgi:Beta-eliminating lyase.